MKLILSLTALLLAPLTTLQAAETPSERDTRMQWLRDARFGMFVHWGLYSGLAGSVTTTTPPALARSVARGQLPEAPIQTATMPWSKL